MTTSRNKRRPAPRFVPFDRRKTPPRDVVSHLCRNEAFKLMQADRKAGLEWTSAQGTAAFRFLKGLTHGEQLDYSSLKFHQIFALQTIFMYVCYFEEKRSLALGICLPGMCTDWYADMFDDVVANSRSTLRDLRKDLPKGAKINFDAAMTLAVKRWREAEHVPEVEARIAQMKSAETTVDTTDAGEPTDEITEAFTNVTPEDIISALSS